MFPLTARPCRHYSQWVRASIAWAAWHAVFLLVFETEGEDCQKGFILLGCLLLCPSSRGTGFFWAIFCQWRLAVLVGCSYSSLSRCVGATRKPRSLLHDFLKAEGACAIVFFPLTRVCLCWFWCCVQCFRVTRGTTKGKGAILSSGNLLTIFSSLIISPTMFKLLC